MEIRLFPAAVYGASIADNLSARSHRFNIPGIYSLNWGHERVLRGFSEELKSTELVCPLDSTFA